MSNTIDINRFNELRHRVFMLIAKELEEDSHCKEYEGRVELSFPNYFEYEYHGISPSPYVITIACYLLCNGRSDIFRGKKFDECLDQFEEWIYSLEEDNQ